MAENKITPEELKRLQDMNQEFTKTKLALADSLLQQQQLLQQMGDLRSAFKVDEKSLMEKYGNDVAIDLATGDIKEVADNNVAEVKEEK